MNGQSTTIDQINQAYLYDANHNRTQTNTLEHTTHYTYEPNSDRLSSITQKDKTGRVVNTTTYTYDNLGNPVMIKTYDHKGNLTSIAEVDDNDCKKIYFGQPKLKNPTSNIHQLSAETIYIFNKKVEIGQNGVEKDD